MKTTGNPIRRLLEEATAVYSTEKEIGGLFNVLLENETDLVLREGILLEAEENKKQCERLEGLLAAINSNLSNSNKDEGSRKIIAPQLALLFKRIVRKCINFEYKTTMLAAILAGNSKIITLLSYRVADQVDLQRRSARKMHLEPAHYE